MAVFVAAVYDRRVGAGRLSAVTDAQLQEWALVFSRRPLTSPLSFGVFLFDSLAEPDLNDGLSRNPNEVGLAIQSLDHPSW